MSRYPEWIQLKLIPSNVTTRFEHHPNNRVTDIQNFIEKKYQVPVNNQKIIYNGKQVKISDSFTDLDIQPNSIFYVVQTSVKKDLLRLPLKSSIIIENIEPLIPNKVYSCGFSYSQLGNGFNYFGICSLHGPMIYSCGIDMVVPNFDLLNNRIICSFCKLKLQQISGFCIVNSKVRIDYTFQHCHSERLRFNLRNQILSVGVLNETCISTFENYPMLHILTVAKSERR